MVRKGSLIDKSSLWHFVKLTRKQILKYNSLMDHLIEVELLTWGDHCRYFLAFVMSGLRFLGSSCIAGLFTILLEPPSKRKQLKISTLKNQIWKFKCTFDMLLNYPKLIHVYSKNLYRIEQINIPCYVNVCILSINLNSIKKNCHK